MKSLSASCKSSNVLYSTRFWFQSWDFRRSLIKWKKQILSMLGEDFWEGKVMRNCFLSYLTFFSFFSRIILKALAKELRFLKKGTFFSVFVPSFHRTLVWNPNCCPEWEHTDQQDWKISFRVRQHIFKLFLSYIFS